MTKATSSTLSRRVTTGLAIALGTFAPLAPAAEDTVLSHYSFAADSLVQWKLPKKLTEISGLAATPDGRLFAHGDEQGVVYQIDYANGSLIKAFALGDPAVRDDFEGIAVAGDVVYLVTSNGTLYRARVGGDGEHVGYQRSETGIQVQCEIEGLAVDSAGRELLLACKASRAAAQRDVRTIYRWSLQEQRVVAAHSISIDATAVARRLDTKDFNPSGIEYAGAAGHMILVAARQRALVEVDATGSVVAALRLPLSDRHRQPEGIAIAPDGRLIIADEGGNGRAHLGVYRPTQ
jgi:uncharacterized protein YjiK